MPKIGGIVSGMDTDTILAQLKSIAQQPITKLQAKKTELEKKSAAWEAVNLKFTAFRNAAKKVTDQFSVKSTIAGSSDTSLLGAQTIGSAETGVHVVRVLKTARGFSSMTNSFAATDTPVMASGTLTLKAGNGTDDHDVMGASSLSAMNDGAGVVLGSIKITDRTGSFAVVDLSSAVTIQDVLDEISSAAGVKVTAKLNEDGTGIVIRDDTGLTTGTVAVEESGGTTAASLHLLGSATDGTLEGGDLNPKYSITVDSSNNTLEGIRDAINDLGGPFVSTIVDDGTDTTPYRLSIASRYTGDSSTVALTSSDPGLTFTTVQSAQDAKVEVGATMPQTFYSRTNVFDKVIQGVSFKVVSADETKTVDITVSANVVDAVGAVKSYIDAYNAIVDEVAKQNSYDAETQTKGGPLFNDVFLSSSLRELTSAVTEDVEGLSTSVSSIFQVGVTAGLGGRLEVNASTLTDWTRDHFADVQALFSSSLNAALDATRTASSTKAGFDVNRVADGRSSSANYGVGNDGWMDDTPGAAPDYVTIKFDSPRSLTRAVIHTLNTEANPVSAWGLKDYEVQGLRVGADEGEDASWVTLASVNDNTRESNSHVINYLTSQLRLKITGVHAADGYSRLVEFEAREATGITRRTDAIISRITDTSGGLFTTARAEIKSEQKRLDSQIEATNDRVNREIAKLEYQFNQMEKALSRNQTMSQALTNALNGSAAAKTK